MEKYLLEKRQSLLKNGAGKMHGRLKLDPCLSSCTKINSKTII
jgi:hypothetical protein